MKLQTGGTLAAVRKVPGEAAPAKYEFEDGQLTPTKSLDEEPRHA